MLISIGDVDTHVGVSIFDVIFLTRKEDAIGT
jgi:hypothetical protein